MRCLFTPRKSRDIIIMGKTKELGNGFLFHFRKGGDRMNEMKLDRAWEELKKAEEQVTQKQHKLQQAENRIRHMRNKKDRERTHHLCERAGMLEAIAPDTKQLSSNDFYGFMSTVFSYPNVSELLKKYLSSYKERGD